MNSKNKRLEIKIKYTNETCAVDSNNIEVTRTICPSNRHTPREILSQSNNNSRFLCKFCECNYPTCQTLTVHLKTKHPDKTNQIKKENLEKKRQKQHKCYICKIKFKVISDLNNHMSSHHPYDVWKLFCIYCKAFFKSQNEINDHLLTKHEIKSFIFKCNICGYWTIKKSHYNQHLKIHTDTKQFQCQSCDYFTSYLSNFNTHQLIHHSKDRPYVCNHKDCCYRTTTKSALRVHQFRHNPDKYMIFCDQCNYKTIYKQSLNKHLESHRRNSICLT